MSRGALRMKTSKASFTLILKGVRCFVRRTRIPIHPLTILVGENSSGKSTVLAMLSAVLGYGFPYRTNFGEPPYRLGAFRSIATVRKFRTRGSFQLGVASKDYECVATFANHEGEARLSGLEVNLPHERLHLAMDGLRGSLEVQRRSGDEWVRKEKQSIKPWRGDWETAILGALLRPLKGRFTPPLAMPRRVAYPAVSMAPIRTPPRHAYGVSGYSTEGDHIPWAMVRGFEKGGSSKELKLLLATFGKDSGLFDRVRPQLVDRKNADLMRLFVTLGGGSRNLADVGYGVSQALPVVVQTWITSGPAWLLIQQPEVHLHPRAQAALGSLFAAEVGQSGRQIVVETHSDFIIDRIRLEIARGVIRPDQVQLLYFERQDGQARVHSIFFDKLGNVLNAPRGYRDFFLEEERSLLLGRPLHVPGRR